MTTSRIPVGLNDHQRGRIEAYAARHGASLAGAILALALRQLDGEDETLTRDRATATEARQTRSRKNSTVR